MAPLLRFAPSPTGPLHLGGLRTALINHLFARKHGGKWILRVEDTDAARTIPGSLDGIRKGLSWAGLDYDYGPLKPGPHGPYFQSERLDLYRSYAKKLVEDGHAYRCFCSPTRLTETRERLARSGSNSSYDKACLSLTEEESNRRVKAGESYVVRLNDSILPERSTTEDLIFGQRKESHGSLGTDPILLKSDQRPTYHLANVVDDHEMGITHVIRGEEWLTSLPLHLDLYSILKLKPPRFAHLPLLLNPDGSKMSKRTGNVRVEDYIQRGWEPDAVLNWLVLAGWGVSHENRLDPEHSGQVAHPTCSNHKRSPDSTTFLTREAMLQQFDLTAITHHSIVLDPFKLEVVNKAHLANYRPSELAIRAKELVEKAYPNSQLLDLPYIERVLEVVLPRLTILGDLPTQVPFFFVDPPAPSRALMSTHSIEHVLGVVQSAMDALARIPSEHWNRENIAASVRKLHADDALGSKFMSAVRIAISGMKAGPPVPDIIAIMGKARTLHIFSRVKNSLDTSDLA